MSDRYTTRAKQILEKIIYATIATASKDGKPWNSPVRHFSLEQSLPVSLRRVYAAIEPVLSEIGQNERNQRTT